MALVQSMQMFIILGTNNNYSTNLYEISLRVTSYFFCKQVIDNIVTGAILDRRQLQRCVKHMLLYQTQNEC